MRSCPRDLVSRADYLRRTLTSVYDNMGKNTPTVYISQVPHTPRPCTRAQLSSALHRVLLRVCARGPVPAPVIGSIARGTSKLSFTTHGWCPRESGTNL